LKRRLQRILDVRTSAHLQCDTTALLERDENLARNTVTKPTRPGPARIESHLSDVHRLQRERSPYKTVKLTPVTGSPKRKTLPARYANVRPSKQTKPPAYLFS